ncbi:hypothetical protein [Mycoplasma leonicaptivi]|uniref:hypothetical protein n=1 Tax=Mycoplasma leonicaptivi TaxID=36742 RepID=UPI0004846E97|nr:hypothetical protein [Mycoplasma leonicaptivi]
MTIEINKLTNNATKRQELLNAINQTNNPAEVETKKQEAIILIKQDKTTAQTEVNKLTANKQPRINLQQELDNAQTQAQIETVKQKVQQELNNFKQQATQAVNKLGGEKAQDLTTATQTNTQQAYEDLTAQANTRFREMQNEAKTKLNQVTNTQKRADIESRINNAPDKATLDALKQEIDLEISKQDALVVINKLSNTNPKKQELTNDLNAKTTTNDVASVKQQAQTILDTKKAEATQAVAKLEGDIAKVKADRDLTSAQTEDELNKLINDSNNVFNQNERQVNNEINQLIKDQGQFSTSGKNTVKALKDLNTQVVNKAKEHTTAEINKLSDQTKKSEFERELQNAQSVATAYDIRRRVLEQIGFETALSEAKKEAIALADKLKNPQKDQEKAQINAQTTLEGVDAIKQRIQNTLDAKERELNSLKNKFNSTNSVLRANQTTPKTMEAMENAINALNTEMQRIQTEAQNNLNKIKVDQGLLTGTYASENNDYNTQKQEFDKAVANPTEAKFETINSNVNRIFNNRKNQVQNKLNQLGNSTKKTALQNELNSNQTNTRSKLIEIEKKIAIEKEVQRLKTKLNGVKDNNFKTSMTSRLDADNPNIADLEREIDAKLAQEAQDLRIAKEQALAEIAKLPSSEQTQPRNIVNSATEQNVVNQEKDKAIQRLEVIRNEADTEIQKMPVNARSELVNNYVLNNNNGDKLLDLKALAQRTVTKSNALQTEINNKFGSHPAQKTHFENIRNSDKADTIAEIDAITTSLPAISSKLTEVKTAQSQLQQSSQAQFNNRINSAFDVNTLNNILNDIKLQKAKDDAQAAINNLKQTQRSALENEYSAARTQTDYEAVKNKAIDLKNKIDLAQQKINTIPASNRNELQSELDRATNNDLAIRTQAKVDPFLNAINETRTEIQSIADNNKKNGFMSELNAAQNEAKVREILARVRNYKDVVRARQGAQELLNRLNNTNFKTQKANIINDDNQTPANITNAVNEVRNYLNAEKTKAQNALNRLENNNQVKTARQVLTNDTNTEAQYQETVQKVNEEIGKILTEALSEIGKLSQDTINANNLYNNIDTNSVQNNTERELRSKIDTVRRILDTKRNEARSAVNKINGASEYNNLNTRLNSATTETELQNIQQEAENLWNAKIQEINTALNDVYNTNQRTSFENERNSASNYSQLNTLLNKIQNYYEIREFWPDKQRWESETVLTNIKFNKQSGNLANKYLYLVVNNNGNKVVSNVQRFDNSTLRFTLNDLKFIYEGEYRFEKIVYSDQNNLTDQQVINNSNTIKTEFSRNQNFFVNNNNFFAENVKVVWNKENSGDTTLRGADLIESAYNYNITISGLKSKNLYINRNKEIIVKIKGSANTGSQIATNKNKILYHNLEFRYPISSLQSISETGGDEFTTLVLNRLPITGLRAGYKYKLSSIKFGVSDRTTNKTYDDIYYSVDGSTEPNTKNIIYLNRNYTGERTAEAWIFNSNLFSFDQDGSKSVWSQWGTYVDNIYHDWITRLAFNNGWDAETFGALFSYLNSRVPDTDATYTFDAGDRNRYPTTEYNLRDRWVWLLTDQISKAFVKHTNGTYRRSPNDKRKDHKWAVSGIQLGYVRGGSTFDNIFTSDPTVLRFAPVLGGRRINDLGHKESVSGFMQQLDNRDNTKITLAENRDISFGEGYQHNVHDYYGTIWKAINWILTINSSNFIGKQYFDDKKID